MRNVEWLEDRLPHLIFKPPACHLLHRSAQQTEPQIRVGVHHVQWGCQPGTAGTGGQAGQWQMGAGKISLREPARWVMIRRKVTLVSACSGVAETGIGREISAALN